MSNSQVVVDDSRIGCLPTSEACLLLFPALGDLAGPECVLEEPRGFLSRLAARTPPMPLAHPLSIHPSANYSQPSIAITFATALPGEDVESFQSRIIDVGPWGQNGVGRSKVELVLTKVSALRLVEMIATLA